MNYALLSHFTDEVEGNLELAISYLDKSIQIRPDAACSYNNRGILYAKLKDFEKAINDYKQCIKYDYQHWVYYQLWYLLDMVGKYEEALQYARLGASIHPDDLNYEFCLGVANDRLENYEIAIEHYRNYYSSGIVKESSKKQIEKNIYFAEINIYFKHLNKAIKFYENNNYQQACVNFNIRLVAMKL